MVVRSFSRQDHPTLRALGVEPCLGDLGDPQAVSRAVAGCDVVFHVAAKPGIWGPYEEYHRANVTGTENLLRACAGLPSPPKVALASSSNVYGIHPGIVSEEVLPLPVSDYGRSKLAMESVDLLIMGEIGRAHV